MLINNICNFGRCSDRGLTESKEVRRHTKNDWSDGGAMVATACLPRRCTI